MDIQLQNVEITKLPDAFVLGGRHIDGQDGYLVLPMSPLARNRMQGLGVSLKTTVIVAVFVPMDYMCHVATYLESEGLELSEL